MTLGEEKLKPSEERIIWAMLEGHTTNKAIADHLGTTAGTVKRRICDLSSAVGIDRTKYLVRPRLLYMLAVQRGMTRIGVDA